MSTRQSLSIGFQNRVIHDQYINFQNFEQTASVNISVYIFCEMDKGAVRLCVGRLELAEETFCEILSDCRGERDMESDEIGKNHDIGRGGDLTGLTTIWSRRLSAIPSNPTSMI